MSMLMGVLIFPIGWDTPSVREVCGPESDSYAPGQCSIRWAFILAIIGVVDCLVLSILAFVLGTRFVKELPDQYLKKDSQAYKGKFKRYFFLLKPRFMAWKKLKLFYAKKASMKKSYL